MKLLIGSYAYQLDAKNRMFLPPKFREELKAEGKSHFYLANGFDGCLFLFLPSQWENLLANNMQSFRTEDKDAERAFKRHFFATAQEATVDSQGRVLVDPMHRAYAGLKKDVMVVGVGNRAEIWDKKKWEAYNKKQLQGSLKKLASRIEL